MLHCISDGLQDPPKSFCALWVSVFKTTRLQMLETTGLDAYMHTRLLSMCFRMCLVLWVLALCVILPVNVVGGHSDDPWQHLSMENIEPGSNLMWAHVVVAYITYFFAMYMVKKVYDEVRARNVALHALRVLGCGVLLMRDASLAQFSELHHRYMAQRGTSQHTVFVQHVPKSMATSDAELHRLFDDFFPGAVYGCGGCSRLRSGAAGTCVANPRVCRACLQGDHGAPEPHA